MKRYSIRSKSDSSTLTPSINHAPHTREGVEKAEKASLLPPDAFASECAHVEDASIADDHGLKLLSLGQVDGVPPVGTLIFIHGLGGHFTRTWSHERDSTSFGLKFGFPRQRVCAPFESCLLVTMRQYFVLRQVLPASMILPEHYS